MNISLSFKSPLKFELYWSLFKLVLCAQPNSTHVVRRITDLGLLPPFCISVLCWFKQTHTVMDKQYENILCFGWPGLVGGFLSTPDLYISCTRAGIKHLYSDEPGPLGCHQKTIVSKYILFTPQILIIWSKESLETKKWLLATLLLPELGIAYFNQKYKGFQGFFESLKEMSIIYIKIAIKVFLMHEAFFLMSRRFFWHP